MAIKQDIVCDNCGFHYNDANLKLFYLDFAKGKIETALVMRNFRDNKLLRGYVHTSYCSNCSFKCLFNLIKETHNNHNQIIEYIFMFID